MKTLRFNIDGMHCDGCVGSVRGELERLNGVTASEVDLHHADVSFDESSCGAAEIVAAIQAAGSFNVTGFVPVEE